MSSLPPLVITGANGFIGRHLLGRLAALGHRDVLALARDANSLMTSPSWRPEWRALSCDLTRDVLPVGDIARGAVVLHMAAATGKMSPSAMRLTNVAGTQRVLQGARAARAGHLVFLSSIAAGFRDRRWYHYADSKQEAERLVAGGGMPYSVVRPTMVFGRGSAVGTALEGLATSGAPIMLGNGRVRTQPVHVDDVVSLLLALSQAEPAGGDTLELGGADRLTMRELIAAIRAARALPARRVISVPLGVVRTVLGIVEPIARPLLPITAGQLAAFVNDSIAAVSERVRALLPNPMGITAIL
ncbi:MAG: NAD(P)-dependent oxidoreductase, partial [Gemmatimonadaceae bacterium]